MKKILTLLLALLLTTSLASCGGDDTSSSSTASKANESVVETSSTVSSESSSEDVVSGMKLDTTLDTNITFWHTMGNTGNKYNALLKGISDFKTLYPNITVTEHSTGGGYDDARDQIIKGIQIEETPNIAYCYPDHVALYNAAKRTRILDDFIDDPIYGYTGDEIDDFVPAFWNEGKSFGNDSMYLLPFSKSTEVLYYNKTLFAEKGWTVPATWDDAWTLSQTILDSETGKHLDTEGKAITVIPFGIDSGANWFITMTEQAKTPYTSLNADGTGSYDFNTKENQDFVANLKAKYTAGLITTQGVHGGFVNINSENPLFYMAIGSSAGCTYHVPAMVNGEYPFEVGVATIPQYDLDNKQVISQGPDIVMLKSYNKDATAAEQEELASWLFMKYLTSPEFTARFSMASGYMPVRESSKDIPAFKTWLATSDEGGNENITATAAKVAMNQADNYYTSVSFNGSSKARSEIDTLITQVLTTDKAIADLFAAALSNCEF